MEALLAFVTIIGLGYNMLGWTGLIARAICFVAGFLARGIENAKVPSERQKGHADPEKLEPRIRSVTNRPVDGLPATRRSLPKAYRGSARRLSSSCQTATASSGQSRRPTCWTASPQ